MTNFWDHHGVFFLIFITIFPRLTLFFSSVAFGGIFWWIGFIFAPRILVAILATLNYWSTNPILVVISWVVAFSGESGEKKFVTNRVRVVRFGGGPGGFGRGTEPRREREVKPVGDIVDTDYERIE